jgi:D-lactate dehydrogenase
MNIRDILSTRILAGVGIDVIEGEEALKEETQAVNQDRLKEFNHYVSDLILSHPDKVVFTPHIAFYSQEALERILDTTIANIICFHSKRKEYCKEENIVISPRANSTVDSTP